MNHDFIRSLSFVNCERTILFSVNRDLAPPPPPPLYHPQYCLTSHLGQNVDIAGLG